MKNSAFIFIACVIGFGLSSCSIGYNHEWKLAAKDNFSHDARGAWIGTWRSEASGHHGVLRAVVTPASIQSKQYDFLFHYHATYAKILSGSFTARHRIDENGKLTGTEDLGAFAGGVYNYEGHVTPTEFHATYRSAADHGVFEMTRP